MSTLLRVDASPLGSDASFSRQLTAEFVQHWQNANPASQVITRDLASTPLSALNAEWIGAAYTKESDLTPRQQEVLALSNELIAELQTADEYVFGVPMHNFSVPGTLKLWIDLVARSGKTFTYEGGTPKGLLSGKKATFLIASGGVYAAGTPIAAMNFVEPYLRSLFAFIGVTDTTFITAGGASQVRFGVDRATILQPALTSIRTQLQNQLQAA